MDIRMILPPPFKRDRLELEAAPHRGGFRVTHNWDCPVTRSSGVGPFIVPAGFLFDGASIPWPFWWIVGTPMDPRLVEAAAAHDYLYRFGAEMGVTRAQADRLFLDLLKLAAPRPSTRWPLRLPIVHSARVGWYAVRCWLMWSGVRAAGWLFWCKRGDGGEWPDQTPAERPSRKRASR